MSRFIDCTMPEGRSNTWRSTMSIGLLLLAGCAAPVRQPVELARHVDIARFMGDWYVIASIPTPFERGAHNAIENYRLAPDGSIATTFSFNADGPQGERRTYRSVGYVLDPGTHAVWGQQYVWPIRADYRISHVSPDYSQTVITRDKRDYVWIMARTPRIPAADLERLKAFVARQGYDPQRLREVPQHGADTAGPRD